MHEGRLLEEVNMVELHKRKRRYIEIDSSDVKKAAKLLTNDYQITDYAIQGNTIKIYDFAHSPGEINKTFVENGLLVTTINANEENLEDYFSELIGGGSIA